MRDGIFKHANLSKAWKRAFNTTTLDALYFAEADVHFHNALRESAADVDSAVMRQLARAVDGLLFRDKSLVEHFRELAGRDPNRMEGQCLRHADAEAGDGRMSSREVTNGVASALSECAQANLDVADSYACRQVRRGNVDEGERKVAMQRSRDTVSRLDVGKMANDIVAGRTVAKQFVQIRVTRLDSVLSLGSAAIGGMI